MRYAIFSDIHSNLQALEVVLEAYLKEQIDKYLCVGDIVGYAANPKECIKIIENLNPITIAGNHDWGAVDLISIEYFNPVAKEAILWTKNYLDNQEKESLKLLKLVYTNDEFTMVHGTLENPQEFDYLVDTYTAKKTFDLIKNNLCFVGHSHIAGVFIKEKNRISYQVPRKLEISKDKLYIVNVGSVGQPRDGNPKASFCIYDTSTKILELKRIDYDIKEAQKRIIYAGLPLFLAERLSIGH